MLSSLAPFTDDGRVRVVVESPRNSTLKYEFEPALNAVTISRQLMTGLAYPYDWGFVPGTKAEDGDPLDALVLHSSPTFPGVVLPCQPLGVVVVKQKDDETGWISNDRLIVRPAWEGHTSYIDNVADLHRQTIQELERFFLNTAFFTGKKLRIQAWRGPRFALQMIKRVTVKGS